MVFYLSSIRHVILIIIDIIINSIIATKKQQNMKSITSAILKAMFCLGDVHLFPMGGLQKYMIEYVVTYPQIKIACPCYEYPITMSKIHTDDFLRSCLGSVWPYN